MQIKSFVQCIIIASVLLKTFSYNLNYKRLVKCPVSMAFHGRSQMDSSIKLRFKKTIKIDPDIKTPVSQMKFSPKTAAMIAKKGFEFMTPVQSQSYEHVYGGTDVVARSRTGTGKTLAFGLPLIEKLVAQGLNTGSNRNLPLVLVLEPTRELAIQVAQELSVICETHHMRVQPIFGGSSFVMQETALRNGLHILVGTPGRVLDHISRGTLDLSHIKHVVLDEGDTMLEMGFQKSVESIILNVRAPGEASRRAAAKSMEDPFSAVDGDFGGKSDVQMLLFSATMPGWICGLTDKHMRDPVFLDAVQEGETRLASTITHHAVRLTDMTSREAAISKCIEDITLLKGAEGQTIVFTNTKEDADRLSRSEIFGHLRTRPLHGDVSQAMRQNTIRAFKEGNVDVLVATDVAARGLDIAGVDLVVHASVPLSADTYVHRSGRTGRAGRNGTAVVLYSSYEQSILNSFERQLNFRFTKQGQVTPQKIVESSVVYASKKLQMVTPEVVSYFMPHAERMIRELTSAAAESIAATLTTVDETSTEGDVVTTGAIDATPSDTAAVAAAADISSELQAATTTSSASVVSDEMMSTSTGLVLSTQYEVQKVIELVARSLAAISNRNTITCRSLLTGQDDYITIQVEAHFKNGSTPDNLLDWTKLINGVFRKSLNMEEFKLGKIAMAYANSADNVVTTTNTTTRPIIALLDLDYEKAQEVLQLSTKMPMPSGLKLSLCESLPELVDKFSVDVSTSSSGSAFGSSSYSSSGGGYSSRSSSYGSGYGGGGGSSYPSSGYPSRSSSSGGYSSRSSSYGSGYGGGGGSSYPSRSGPSSGYPSRSSSGGYSGSSSGGYPSRSSSSGGYSGSSSGGYPSRSSGGYGSTAYGGGSSYN